MRPFSIALAIAALTASSGCWSQTPARTLGPEDLATARQVEVLNNSVAASIAKCEDVELRFRPGTYRGVRLFIDDRGRKPGCDATVTVDREGGDGTVLFDGDQQPKFIDIVTHRAAFPGTIRNLVIRDYMNGIAVVRTNSKPGERVEWAAGSDRGSDPGPGVTISNLVFRDVGDWEQDPAADATGWGAILFNFTHNNTVVGNRFEGLGNSVESPLMHALYLVGSSGNKIENNHFGAMDGAVIKLRNRSDNNRIVGNVFRYGGEPLLQLWFCNQGKRGDENCPVFECPSTGTLFANNRIIRSSERDRTRRGGGPVPVTNPFVSYETAEGLRLVERFYVSDGVPASCPHAGAKVIRPGSGNLIQRTG